MARTQRFRELAESLNPAFVIVTGDLVRDALRVGEAEATGYYELFKREVALFKSPVWTVPGNHEIRWDVSAYGSYREHLEQTAVELTVGGVHTPTGASPAAASPAAARRWSDMREKPFVR